MSNGVFSEVSIQFPLSSTPWERPGDKRTTSRMTLWEFIMTIAVTAMANVCDSIAGTSLRELLAKGCGYTNLTPKVIESAKGGLRDMLSSHADDYPIHITLLSGEISENMKLSDKLMFKIEAERISKGKFLMVNLSELAALRGLAHNLRFDRLLSLYFYLKSNMTRYTYSLASTGGNPVTGYGAWIRRSHILHALGLTENDTRTYRRYLDTLVVGGMISYTPGSLGLDSTFVLGKDHNLMDVVIRKQKAWNLKNLGNSRGKYEEAFAPSIERWKQTAPIPAGPNPSFSASKQLRRIQGR